MAEEKDPLFNIERMLSAPTRAELFNISSSIFQAMNYQHMALRSIRSLEFDEFEHEMNEASKGLTRLFQQLNQLLGDNSNGD